MANLLTRTVRISPARLALLAVTAAWIALDAFTAHAQLERRLLSRDQVGRLGLERAWFAQVQVDRGRNRVVRWVLDNDQILALTSAGLVHALDAHTGQTAWTVRIGNPAYPSLGPTANAGLVAVMNGSTLYLLDRSDGRPVMVREIGGAPGSTPALGEHHAFVPLIYGRIEAYPVEGSGRSPWFYQSSGRSLVAPMATSDILAWTTDRGYLYVASAGDEPGVRFRIETGTNFVAPPAYSEPHIFAANEAGEVFAVHESTGHRRWKHGTGYPITRAPAVVAGRVLVTSERPVLHAIDAQSGADLWEARSITQFAAASSSRVYALDDVAGLVVLDAASGAPLGRMATDGFTNAIVNDQTDRLYFVSDDGRVQCLHELGAREPLYHQRRAEPRPEEPAPPDDYAPEEEPTPPPPDAPPDERDPFMPEPDAPPPAEEDSFGVDEEDPFAF